MHSENGHVFFPFLDFPFRILSFPELVCVVQHSGGELSTLGDNNSPWCIAISPPIMRENLKKKHKGAFPKQRLLLKVHHSLTYIRVQRSDTMMLSVDEFGMLDAAKLIHTYLKYFVMTKNMMSIESSSSLPPSKATFSPRRLGSSSKNGTKQFSFQLPQKFTLLISIQHKSMKQLWQKATRLNKQGI